MEREPEAKLGHVRRPAPGPPPPIKPKPGHGFRPAPGPPTPTKPKPKPRQRAAPGQPPTKPKPLLGFSYLRPANESSMPISFGFKDPASVEQIKPESTLKTSPPPLPAKSKLQRGFNYVSMCSESEHSMPDFPNFKDCASMELIEPKIAPPLPTKSKPRHGVYDTCLEDEGSMPAFCNFKDFDSMEQMSDSETDSLRGDAPSGGQRFDQHMDDIFMRLEENIVKFVKKELKRFQRVLCSDYPDSLESPHEENLLRGKTEEQRISRESFVKITVDFLKRMKQEELAEVLHSRMVSPLCQRKLKSTLKEKFQCVFEGVARAGNPTFLNHIFTELYMTEGGAAGINDDHEVMQIEVASRTSQRPEKTITCEEIFKPIPGRLQPMRTVMTKGVAGIGKTVLTQKFTLDWAEGKASQHIELTFPFTFRELNVLKEKKFSLVELLHYFFHDTKEAGICSFEDFQVVFIFDGLDECRLPLDFDQNQVLSDVTVSTSVDVLLTNLIRGHLLPSARLWITTRPAAASQIPAENIDLVTEVRGFAELQKEEYFRKRFTQQEQASSILSYIKTSRSVQIMCHIPIFCWITATVFEDLLKTRGSRQMPTTLTEMYIYFLMVQIKVKNVKYDKKAETEPDWNEENSEMIQALAKLAFVQLMKRNLLFYQSDLIDCGINIKAASVYSGVFTQVFKEEKGLYEDKVFCFIHLTVQEFLAALHVHLTFINSGVNLLSEDQTNTWWSKLANDKSKLSRLHQSAVDIALESPKGHLDLLVRFLLGLSLPTNQTLLQGLLKPTGNSSETIQETVQYIKKKIRKKLSAERSINMFHCLSELKDHSLVNEIQKYLSSGNLSTDKLSPGQWAALVFILLSSEKELDEFDLKKYSASEDALVKLLPVVKASTKALLDGCNLSEKSGEVLSSALSSQSSCLRELNLSNNDLLDSGVKLLSVGLASPHCKLEALRLSGCQITREGFACLASALSSNPSHLTELDLSYNHPGELGMKLFSGQERKLDILRMNFCGFQRMRAGLRKYVCELELDPNTVNTELKLFNNDRKVIRVSVHQSYPDHPERFDYWYQLLCKDGLEGSCYWEVEWSGGVHISVSYRGITRKGSSDNGWFGANDQSWSLICSETGGFFAQHSKVRTAVPLPSSSIPHKIGVYLDVPAGTLSFYRVSDELSHLYTFKTTFSERLYPGFGFWLGPGSSVTLCDV